jgi:hypothetical protein
MNGAPSKAAGDNVARRTRRRARADDRTAHRRDMDACVV